MPLLSNLGQDLRYAFRTLRRSPTFTAVAVLSLGLGIGVNTAMFNLVSAILLHPLPVPAPDRLMAIYTKDHINPGFLSCSYPNYKDFRDRNSVFSGLALFSTFPVNFAGQGAPEELSAQIVSGNFFDVLGAKPALGRTFLPQEDAHPGESAVAVISFGFWTRRFASSPQAIGATIRLDNRPFTVIGVAPRSFQGANALVSADFWVPMMMYREVFPLADWFNQRRALLFTPIGRLKPGTNRKQAEADMKTLAAQLELQYPDDNKGRTVILLPMTEALVHPKFREGFVLAGELSMATAGLVLLIACANVGNLMLVRMARRRNEIALRMALGVSRARLTAQLLTESAVLSLAGGALALVLARWTRDLLWNARPPSLAYLVSPGFDLRVLAFTLLISVVAALVFGLAPALHAATRDLAREIRERHSPWQRPGQRLTLRSLLVMGQVAMAVVALTAAGLFLRNLDYARNIDPGFESERLATISLNLKPCQLSDEAGRQYCARIVEKAAGVPGVVSASLASNAPFRQRARSISVDGQEVTTLVDVVDPAYFRTARIPLLRGREFGEQDTPSAPRVGVVNETMARHFWGGKDPIGQSLQFFGARPVEIVGVVRDSAYISLGEAPRWMVYLCLQQNYKSEVTLFARTAGNPAALVGSLSRTVQGLDARMVVSPPVTIRELIEDSLWAQRLEAILFAAFGLLATLLTVVGVYGVISYSVGQRTREIGIRMSVGARPQDVLRQVLAEGAILIAWGLFLGLVATVTVTRVFASLLFGIGARDPLTLAAAVCILLAFGLGACFVPAMRATRINPILALRDE